MQPDPQNHLRIARPSLDLNAAERFWIEGLGLEVLYRVSPERPEESELLILGWPEATWHLELVRDPDGATLPVPSEEDLLVLYLGGPIDAEVTQRLTAAGGTCVPAHNPYWDQWGITIADPDGYRLVLSHRTWE